MLGSIAPDADKTKESHYRVNSPSFQYGLFMEKYREQRKNAYYIGYLSHLVADDIWQMYRYYSGLREASVNNELLVRAYYHDFRLLNAKLLEDYGKQELLRNLVETPQVPDIEEVSGHKVIEFRKEAITHFDYSIEESEEKLSVITMPVVKKSMEQTVRRMQDLLNLWK